ncbi:MAG TPA: hypothetical protein VIJ79_14810 [Acidobacteriaceae bacterium]
MNSFARPAHYRAAIGAFLLVFTYSAHPQSVPTLPLASDLVQHPLPKPIPLLVSQAVPVYTSDERLIRALGPANLFIVQLDSTAKPASVEPVNGFSLFWPTMEVALRSESFEPKYAGKQVLVRVPAPHDDKAIPGTRMTFDHLPSRTEMDDLRAQRGMLPCSDTMSTEDLIRQGNRFNSEYRADAQHCFEMTLQRNPDSIAALWGLALWGTPQQKAISYRAIFRIRPEFYDARVDEILNRGNRNAGDAVIEGLQQLLLVRLPAPTRYEVLKRLTYALHEAGRNEEELPLLDEKTGYELQRTSLQPERYEDYSTVNDVTTLALRFIGMGRAAIAANMLRVALEIAGHNPDLYEKYVVYSLRLDLAYALAAAGRESEAANACKDIRGSSVPRNEINFPSHWQERFNWPESAPTEVGSLAIVELRKQLFCGNPAAALPALQQESIAHPEFVSIHKILSDYDNATGKWSDADGEERLWLRQPAK